MAPEPTSPSARWERQTAARLAGLGPWLTAFWLAAALAGGGALLLFFLPR